MIIDRIGIPNSKKGWYPHIGIQLIGVVIRIIIRLVDDAARFRAIQFGCM